MDVREWRDEIVFLHKVKAGAADRSYGIQVAKLAGLPKPVTRRAAEVLALLEKSDGKAGDRASAARRPAAVCGRAPKSHIPAESGPSPAGGGPGRRQPGRADPQGGAGSPLQVERLGAQGAPLRAGVLERAVAARQHPRATSSLPEHDGQKRHHQGSLLRRPRGRRRAGRRSSPSTAARPMRARRCSSG